MSEQLPTINQLQWQCRRGLLELDYLFAEFLQAHYGGLDDKLKQDFVKLLTFADQDLQHWLLYEETPTDPSMSAIIARIRQSRLPTA